MPTVCQHIRTSFRKSRSANTAIIRCLDCGKEREMSMQAAFERIIKMTEEQP